MAKNLLGIVCSPRKFGNSELFIKELYRQLSGDWELTLMRLPELDIRPCRACYQCLFGEMRCPQDDDFSMALRALIESDAYIVAAPTYLWGRTPVSSAFWTGDSPFMPISTGFGENRR